MPSSIASRFQFFAPNVSTISLKRRSSSSVHFPPTGALRGGRYFMSTAAPRSIAAPRAGGALRPPFKSLTSRPFVVG